MAMLTVILRALKGISEAFEKYFVFPDEKDSFKSNNDTQYDRRAWK